MDERVFLRENTSWMYKRVHLTDEKVVSMDEKVVWMDRKDFCMSEKDFWMDEKFPGWKQ